MSSPGTAPAEERMYVAQKTITIENGDVILEDKDVYVSPRAIIRFVNRDPNDYVIMFFARGQNPYQLGAIHADVDMFLPAFDARTMVAGLNLKTGECQYRVIPVPAVFLGEKSILPKIGEQTELSDQTIVFKTDVLCTEDLSLTNDPIDPIVRLAHAEMRSAKTGGGGGGGTIHIG